MLNLEAGVYGARAEGQVLVRHLPEARIFDHRLELLLKVGNLLLNNKARRTLDAFS